MRVGTTVAACTLVAGLAASAATPTLASDIGQTPDSIARQYDSLALPSDTYTVNAKHGRRAGRVINALSLTFTAE